MKGTEPGNQIRNQILQYGVMGLVVNGQNGHFQKYMISMAYFYIGMYLVMRGTEPRNQIRNRILQYGVMKVVVNGQNGHFQKYMIPMASFLCIDVPSH